MQKTKHTKNNNLLFITYWCWKKKREMPLTYSFVLVFTVQCIHYVMCSIPPRTQ